MSKSSSYWKMMEDDESLENNKSSSSAKKGVDRARYAPAGEITPAWSGKHRTNQITATTDSINRTTLSATSSSLAAGGGPALGYSSPTFRQQHNTDTSSNNLNTVFSSKHMPSPFEAMAAQPFSPYQDDEQEEGHQHCATLNDTNHNNHNTINSTLGNLSAVPSASASRPREHNDNHHKEHNEQQNVDHHRHPNNVSQNNNGIPHTRHYERHVSSVDVTPQYHHPATGPTQHFPYSYANAPHGEKAVGRRQRGNAAYEYEEEEGNNHRAGEAAGANQTAKSENVTLRGHNNNKDNYTSRTTSNINRRNSYSDVASRVGEGDDGADRLSAAAMAIERIRRGGNNHGVGVSSGNNTTTGKNRDLNTTPHDFNNTSSGYQQNADGSGNNAAVGQAAQRIKVGRKPPPHHRVAIKHQQRVSSRTTTTIAADKKAPYAAHYQLSSVAYESLQPIEATALMDRYGYHYEAGQAERNRRDEDDWLAETQRRQLEAQHADALLKQMDEKKRRIAMRRDDDAMLDCTTANTLVGIGQDAEQRALKAKLARKALEEEWLREAAAKRERDAGEREALRPYEEDWNILEAEARRRELHNLSEQERLRREEQLRLAMWRSEQERKAAEQQAIEAERQRVEELTLGHNIANYAERIVLAEEQKRRDQQIYKQQLDEQIRAKHMRNKVLAAEQYELECRLGSY